MTDMLFSFCEETAAYTNAQTDDDEILHTMSTAKRIFAKGRDMRIIRESHSQTHTVTKHRCQRNNALPRQIGSILNTARYRSGARCTDTHRANSLVTTIGLYQCHDFLT